MTLTCEGVGAALLALWFCPRYGLDRGLLDVAVPRGLLLLQRRVRSDGPLQREYSSFTAYAGDPLVSLTICALILVGGLGFLVWDDLLIHGRHVRRWRLHSKIVTVFTAVFFLGGGLAFYLLERDRAFAGLAEMASLRDLYMGGYGPTPCGRWTYRACTCSVCMICPIRWKGSSR